MAAGMTSVALKDGTGASLSGLAAQDGSNNVAPAHVLVDTVGTPIALTNALPTRHGSVTPTAAGSLIIVTGGAAQTLFAAGVVANGYRVTNPVSAVETLYLDDTGVAASPTSAGMIPLLPGAVWEGAFPPTTSVSIYGATTGHVFSAVRY